MGEHTYREAFERLVKNSVGSRVYGPRERDAVNELIEDGIRLHHEYGGEGHKDHQDDYRPHQGLYWADWFEIAKDLAPPSKNPSQTENWARSKIIDKQKDKFKGYAADDPGNSRRIGRFFVRFGVSQVTGENSDEFNAVKEKANKRMKDHAVDWWSYANAKRKPGGATGEPPILVEFYEVALHDHDDIWPVFPEQARRALMEKWGSSNVTNQYKYEDKGMAVTVHVESFTDQDRRWFKSWVGRKYRWELKHKGTPQHEQIHGKRAAVVVYVPKGWLD